jgi:hypothetical protein
MADEPRKDRTEAMVVAFLEHRKMEQTQDYLARGRRFATIDAGQLSEDWIIAVRSWLARKNGTSERKMDDLTAELQLRGFEPPYHTIKQELATRFSDLEEVEQKKVGGELARQIDMFMREGNETPQ